MTRTCGSAAQRFQIPGKPTAIGRVAVEVIPKVARTALFTLLVMVALVLFFARIDGVHGEGFPLPPLLHFRRKLLLPTLPLFRRELIPINFVVALIDLVEWLQRQSLRLFFSRYAKDRSRKGRCSVRYRLQFSQPRALPAHDSWIGFLHVDDR